MIDKSLSNERVRWSTPHHVSTTSSDPTPTLYKFTSSTSYGVCDTSCTVVSFFPCSQSTQHRHIREMGDPRDSRSIAQSTTQAVSRYLRSTLLSHCRYLFYFTAFGSCSQCIHRPQAVSISNYSRSLSSLCACLTCPASTCDCAPLSDETMKGCQLNLGKYSVRLSTSLMQSRRAQIAPSKLARLSEVSSCRRAPACKTPKKAVRHTLPYCALCECEVGTNIVGDENALTSCIQINLLVEANSSSCSCSPAGGVPLR